MELNINSPSYYTNEYGVEDEIYWMCRELSAFVREKEYSDVIHIIGIVPIIAPKSVIDNGLCKTQKKVNLKLVLHLYVCKWIMKNTLKPIFPQKRNL